MERTEWEIGMAAITVFCKKDSARLRYVLDWLFTQVMHITYELTDDFEEVHDLPFYLSYGAESTCSIPDAGLLWEEGIRQTDIVTGEWKSIPTLFHDSRSKTTLPFDIFSAIFFLISRYEEYGQYTPDKHGRYPASASILSKNNWLQRPLADEWIYELYLLLKANDIPVQLSPYQFIPTYDIDMAYSYKHKGIQRNLGGFAKSFLKGRLAEVAQRFTVLMSRSLDPYDSFVFIKRLHTAYRLKPVYFILASLKTTEYDKNISPKTDVMQRLIRRLKRDGTIALHPSYYSDDPSTFQQEKSSLEQIIGESIQLSRQHYIRLTLPDTYRHLIRQNIQQDYSMGYGAVLGFRAGTGRSFYWYDLENEAQTQLLLHPFCFMETTAHFEEKLSPEDALAHLRNMKLKLQQTQSQLITVFHNFSLGNDLEWKGWSELYQKLVKEM